VAAVSILATCNYAFKSCLDPASEARIDNDIEIHLQKLIPDLEGCLKRLWRSKPLQHLI